MHQAPRATTYQNTEIFLVKSIKLEAPLTTTFLDDTGSFVFILL